MKVDTFIPCQCDSEILRISKWENEDEYYLSVYQFSSLRYSFWERICILFGGKVKTCDIILSKEHFEKLKTL